MGNFFREAPPIRPPSFSPRKGYHMKTPQKYGYARRIVPIRKRIWQRVLIRWCVLIALAVVVLVVCVISEKHPTLRNYPNMVKLGRILSVCVWVFVLFSSGVLKRTFSREWTGIVRGREVVKYTKYPKGPVSRHLTIATKCVWTVEKDDGYIEKVENDTDEVWERYFEIGERVRFYKNAKILVKAHPKKDDENLMCPLCGVMVMEPICRKCGVDFTEEEA